MRLTWKVWAAVAVLVAAIALWLVWPGLMLIWANR